MNSADDDQQTIQRISNSVFSISADRLGDDDIHISAQHVRLFCLYDREIRVRKQEMNWHPAGYNNFAGVYNETHPGPERFALFDPDYEGAGATPILNLDTASPLLSSFGVEPHECFSHEDLTPPGYVTLAVAEHERLLDISTRFSASMVNGRKRAEDRKLRKKNAMAAEEERKKGGFHYVDTKHLSGGLHR
ncbi:hypothetical protein LENED_005968 [Lentinula edodes]|uniref:Uncharacterized protein n=1 Tax=Lentinula edodes TaxID=5353 RepID=A0A1Q3EAF6_LENED|nr:hypothetical protein F5051DRAFT_28603 [Lentinula edodes]GAW04193.1 hypothetical protein LENED_005968 [Lentinula edodes]